MAQKFINNFRTTVAATFGAGDTQLQLTSVTGLPALSGGDFFYLTVFRLVGIIESGWEVIKVTGIAGNILTVVRAVEGAAASQFAAGAGSIVAARITAGALEAKADAAAVNTALATKADGATTTTALAGKADAAATTTALNSKADSAATTASLSLKANAADVSASLALKADTSALTSGLAAKADAAATTSALALKADTSAVSTSLALKANVTALDAAIEAQTSRVENITASTATTNIDLALLAVGKDTFVVTLAANTTFAFINKPAGVFSFTIHIVNDATPNRTVAWPSYANGQRWEDNVNPTGARTTVAAGEDIWGMYSRNGGTTIVGCLSHRGVQ